MFTKKKKKPLISMPSNFEHRVHTGFDKRENKYVGLPLQWASIVGNNQILKSSNRPLPLVDPSEITPTEILDLKTIVRPHHNNNNINNNNKADTTSLNSSGSNIMNVSAPVVAPGGNAAVGLQLLPKTSHVARSNSLRSSSPPRVRRLVANVPPSVPEEESQISPGGGGAGTPTTTQTQSIPGHGFKPQQLSHNNMLYPSQQPSQQHPHSHTHSHPHSHGNGSLMTTTTTTIAPLAVRTEQYRNMQHQQQHQQHQQQQQQQTSPVSSVASGTRSTHSHLNSNNNNGQQNFPIYPASQQQQQHLQQQQQQQAKLVGDQNQNPHVNQVLLHNRFHFLIISGKIVF